MGYRLSRRAAFGLGTAVAATSVLGTPALAQDASSEATPGTPEQARRRVKYVYDCAAEEAGGTWNSYISVADGPAVDVASDVVVESYSVNKVAVALTLLDKVDRGLLKLTDTVEVTQAIVVPNGDGIFILDGAYPSVVTLGHVLSLFLTVSDDTCVRLVGLKVPAAEINEILTAKGFPKTQVIPVANPNRYFLGKTTPKEMHDLLQGIVKGTLLSPESSAKLLGLLRSPVAFTDGIRLNMSSADRARVATKAGWLNDGRNEAGIVFDTAGKPVLTYAMFAHGQAHPEDFGSTHPVRRAAAEMGPKFLRAVDRISGTASARALNVAPHRPSYNGD